MPLPTRLARGGVLAQPGRSRLPPGLADVTAVVANVVAAYAGRGYEVAAPAGPVPPCAVAIDANALEQVLHHLVDAVRLLGSDPVTLTVLVGGPLPRAVTVEVAADGYAVDPEEVARVTGEWPADSGAGLALLAGYRLADAYGGRLEFPDASARTTVRLLLDEAPWPARSPALP